MKKVFLQRWFWIVIVFAVINGIGLAKIVSVLEEAPPESPAQAPESNELPTIAEPLAPHELPRKFGIGSVYPYTNEDGTTYVKVYCTKPVDLKHLKDFVRIEPELKFTTEQYYYDGFLVQARFKPGNRYKLSFLKGLKSSDGDVLKKDVVRRVVMPDYPPAMRFDTAGVYLAAQGNQLLPLKAVNLKASEVEIKIETVYRNNLIHYLRDSSHWRPNPGDLGRTVVQRKLKIVCKKNEPTIMNLDLRKLLGENEHGAFLVTAETPENDYTSRRRCRQMVLLSDLGITVKKAPGEILVWVNALSSTQPVDGASVTVFSRKNQEIVKGVTDENGLVHFIGMDRSEEKTPFAVLAARDNDIGMIEIGDHTLSMHTFDIGGRPYLRDGYEAFLYADRGIYRPGDRVHLHGIVRTPEPELPEIFPLRFRILRPDAREFKTIPVTLSEYGSVDADVELPSYALTGRYKIELRLPTDGPAIGTHTFQVEEFMPDRLKVSLSADERRYRTGEELALHVKGMHLFGSPAAGRKVTVHRRLYPSRFSHADWKEYSFHDNAKELSSSGKDTIEGTLDSVGEKVFNVKIPDDLEPAGALMIECVVSVQEVGGRAVTARLSRYVDAYPHYVGIHRDTEGPDGPGQEARLACAFITPDGKGVERAILEAEIYRIWWNTVLKKDRRGRYRYTSERDEERVAEMACPIAQGKGTIVFTPLLVGQYELRVKDPEGGASARYRFYCSGNGDVPWSRETPSHLELAADKSRYSPGDTARVIVKSPFKGRALITLESDRILSAQIVEMQNNTEEISFPVEASFGTNVYCTVTVIKRDETQSIWTAQRAYGTTPIHMEKESRRLTVNITAPEEARPGNPLHITLNVNDADGQPKPCELTLAAVDEGICRLTRFRTPDPWEFFFAKRRLAVETADIYSEIIPEIEKRLPGSDSEPGGGGGPGSGGPTYDPRRLNPVNARRVKPVALWKSRIVVGPSGHAETILDLPAEFNGELRLMAIAASADEFGSAEQPVLVKQPLMIRASLPRALAPQDEFVIPVAVFNQTGADGNVTVNIESSEGVAFSDERSQSVRVASGQDIPLFFRAQAPRIPGPITVKIRAELGEERATQTVEIPVRPPAGLQHVSGSGKVEAGSNAHITLPGNWLATTDEYDITFSGAPTLKLGGSLKYLMRYPYGCIEQTTSRCFPLLYLSDIAATIDPETFQSDEVSVFVQAGIDRILSMQTFRGGFAMWPGHLDEYPWGSVYATHFLVEAKKAGYPVPEDALESALKALERILPSSMHSATKAYACYVLAHAGRANASWTYRLQEEDEEKHLNDYSRFHLAAALALMGERDLAETLLNAPANPAAPSERDTGGVLHSPTRETAILLSIYLDLAPLNPRVPALADELGARMTDGRWMTTQENAFALMALGKYLRRSNAARPDWRAEVTLDGEHIASLTHENKVHVKRNGIGGKTLDVSLAGAGTLYYYWSASGVLLDSPVKEADHNLKIRRRFLNRNGKTLKTEAIPLGEIVIVEITIQAERTARNIIISDLLPAGFEIENPHIATRESFGDLPSENRLYAERTEMRDDRLLIFTNLYGTSKHTYHYAVRAVTAGRFRLPPISAECMYAPSVSSIHGAGEVEVIDER